MKFILIFIDMFVSYIENKNWHYKKTKADTQN